MCPGNERRMRPCTPGPYRDNNVAVSVEALARQNLTREYHALTATITSRSPLKRMLVHETYANVRRTYRDNNVAVSVEA